MFERLAVQNYEAYSKFAVELAKVTTFVGRSDVGKSSLLRLLRWICLNEPSGTASIRWGTSFARGTLTFDGKELIRRMGDKNIYKFDGRVFKAFGRTVPLEIEKALNVGSLNFQQQTAGQFWLCESAPQVSRELNAIIDLGVIDETLSFLASKTRQAKVTVQVSKERLAQARERKKALAHVPALQEAWRDVTQANARVTDAQGNAAKLYTLVQQAEAAEKIVQAARQRLDVATAAQEAATKALGLQKAIRGLSSILEAAYEAEEVSDSPTLDAGLVTRTCDIWQTKHAAWKRLGELINAATDAEGDVIAHSHESQSLQGQLAKAIGPSCPLCGKPNTPTKT